MIPSSTPAAHFMIDGRRRAISAIDILRIRGTCQSRAIVKWLVMLFLLHKVIAIASIFPFRCKVLTVVCTSESTSEESRPKPRPPQGGGKRRGNGRSRPLLAFELLFDKSKWALMWAVSTAILRVRTEAEDLSNAEIPAHKAGSQ